MTPYAGEVAVLDIGKTNVDVWVAERSGRLLDSRSTPNRVLPGPPWSYHDLDALTSLVGETLAELCRTHPIRVIVPVGHGSGGVLVGEPDDGSGAALPMPDYEAPCPPDVAAAYAGLTGSFEDRGSAVMMATTHAARQLLLMERAEPVAFAGARHYLNVAQYWGWWLTGVAASEYSAMGAQSHLWNVPGRRFSPIVGERGWGHLIPAFRPAWSQLGVTRPALARRFGLPDGIAVLTGAHDSTANFYRYLAAGLTDFALVSTGTWIVAMSREADPARLDEARGNTINADPDGNPIGGALAMGGREFTAVAGKDWRNEPASIDALARIVSQGSMALPSFSANDGQFPGSAGRGRIIGPAPATQPERTALALLYTALLTVTCADTLGRTDRLILDGTFLKEPLYAPLVAALRPGLRTERSDESHGVVVGAVLLAGHDTRTGPAPLALEPVRPLALADLAEYARQWRNAAEQGEQT